MALKRFKKGILVVLGFTFVFLGILGIFLPLLPTTVFLLLAAYCFSRSSERFYVWLIHNKWFGNYLKNYRDKKGITIRVKIFSITLVWISILYTTLFFVQNIFVKILLLTIALAVTIHVLTIRTFREEKKVQVD